jgi:predicted small secreted protein
VTEEKMYVIGVALGVAAVLLSLTSILIWVVTH